MQVTIEHNQDTTFYHRPDQICCSDSPTVFWSTSKTKPLGAKNNAMGICSCESTHCHLQTQNFMLLFLLKLCCDWARHSPVHFNPEWSSQHAVKEFPVLHIYWAIFVCDRVRRFDCSLDFQIVLFKCLFGQSTFSKPQKFERQNISLVWPQLVWSEPVNSTKHL